MSRPHRPRPICGALARSTGQPCRVTAVMPNGRCRVHGGASRRPGPLHPAYRTGRYSKALEAGPVRDLYSVARTDPKLLALNEDVALLVAKQQETLGRLRTGESMPAWEAVGAHVAAARDALTRGADDEALAALAQVEEVLAGGMGDHAVWAEFTQRAEQIRKLVDTQRKYEEGLRLYLPLEQANAIMGAWLDVIRRTVPQEYIARMHEELRKAHVGGEWPSMSPTPGHTH